MGKRKQRMAIPKAKFIGLSSADPEAYGLPRNVGIKLNDKDVARARELLGYTWFQTPSPTRISSTSPSSIFPASSKRRTGWTDPALHPLATPGFMRYDCITA